jgi:hypothetical protein
VVGLGASFALALGVSFAIPPGYILGHRHAVSELGLVLFVLALHPSRIFAVHFSNPEPLAIASGGDSHRLPTRPEFQVSSSRFQVCYAAPSELGCLFDSNQMLRPTALQLAKFLPRLSALCWTQPAIPVIHLTASLRVSSWQFFIPIRLKSALIRGKNSSSFVALRG